MKNKISGILTVMFLGTVLIGQVYARELPIDVAAEVAPAGLSKSEMDTWLARNQANFDFYVEGRTVAEHRKDTERRVLIARKQAQEQVARIDERLKEQMTGDTVKDKELGKAAENKKQKVYKEELAMEEALFNRQLRREVDIMKHKRLPETRVAAVQREFREKLVSLRKEEGSRRIAISAAGLPAADPDIANETGGQSKVKIDRQQRVTVESKPYGGEMSERAKRRLENR